HGGAHGDAEVGETRDALGAGTFAEVTGFGQNPGALKMYRYTPSPAPGAGAPLVLALHACSQNATTYRNAGWEELADQHGFWVVYPEQQSVNNALGCFNWAGEYGNPANLQRGQGENQSMKEMVDEMIASHGVDPSRVFLAGHSGGGAQTALMMAVWPDVFAAGGILAGIPYDCTTDFLQVSACLNPGKNFTPQDWGNRVRAAYPGYAGPYPKLSVWHGTTDSVVNPTNQTELIEQWTNVHGISATPTASDVVDGYPRARFEKNGVTVVESHSITGAGHATFVDPDEGCGSLGSYFEDHDICSAFHMADFFGILGGGGSTSSSGGAGGTGGSGGAGGNGTGGAGGMSSGTGGTGGMSSGGAPGAGGNEPVACVPGQQVACACPGGFSSIQICEQDGASYGPCFCGNGTTPLPTCTITALDREPEDEAWLLALGALGLVAMRRRRRSRA
ncbi:MAG: PHB depolymerase family esterase, partial [Myxococcales bacterium]|nr:PHB depolymerase family esterase [Myxococcales bacterium]